MLCSMTATTTTTTNIDTITVIPTNPKTYSHADRVPHIIPLMRTGQVLFSSLLRVVKIDRLGSMNRIRQALAGLIAYSERHYR